MRDETNISNYENQNSGAEIIYAIESSEEFEQIPEVEHPAEQPEKIEESEYASSADVSFGTLRKIDENHTELFVNGHPLSSVVSGESLGRVKSAIEQCERSGHSIWIEQTEEAKIYTEFKKLDESGEVLIRIYTNPDKHLEFLLQKQNEFLSFVPETTEEQQDLHAENNQFTEFNNASRNENGIYIAQSAGEEIKFQITALERQQLNEEFLRTVSGARPATAIDTQTEQEETHKKPSPNKAVQKLTADWIN